MTFHTLQDQLYADITRRKRILLKTLKENDTKATKDVLLHQIFQEIADENNEITDDIYIDDIAPVPKKKLSKIREMQKKRQWIIIIILMIIIIYVLLDSASTSNKSETKILTNDIYAIPQANQAAKQREETALLNVVKEEIKSQTLIKETKPAQMVQKGIPEKREVSTGFQIETETEIGIKDPLTTREKAKKALLLQMQDQ